MRRLFSFAIAKRPRTIRAPLAGYCRKYRGRYQAGGIIARVSPALLKGRRHFRRRTHARPRHSLKIGVCKVLRPHCKVMAAAL